jgi:hypothetical protein
LRVHGDTAKILIPGLSHFQEVRGVFHRNSYGSRICYIYETVKLNQIKLSNQLSYGESENRFKAFIEYDLD